MFTFSPDLLVGLCDEMNDAEKTYVGEQYASLPVFGQIYGGKGDFNKVAASLYSPESGIFLEVFTDQPGIQVYTGNFLDGTRVGKKGIKYPMRASVCLETQLYPDSPNKWKDHVKGWYNPYLEPGQKYYHHTAFKFSVK